MWDSTGHQMAQLPKRVWWTAPWPWICVWLQHLHQSEGWKAPLWFGSLHVHRDQRHHQIDGGEEDEVEPSMRLFHTEMLTSWKYALSNRGILSFKGQVCLKLHYFLLEEKFFVESSGAAEPKLKMVEWSSSAVVLVCILFRPTGLPGCHNCSTLDSLT